VIRLCNYLYYQWSISTTVEELWIFPH